MSLGARLCAPKAVVRPSLSICHPCFMSVLPKGSLGLRNAWDSQSSAGWRPSSHIIIRTQFGFASFFTPRAPLQNTLWQADAEPILMDKSCAWGLAVRPCVVWLHDHTLKHRGWGGQCNNASHCFSSPWHLALPAKMLCGLLTTTINRGVIEGERRPVKVAETIQLYIPGAGAPQGSRLHPE